MVTVQKKDCKISARANVLGFRIVNFWNDLPEYVVTASSVNVFKNRFDKHCSHMGFSTDVHDWWWNTANNKISLQAHSLWKTEEDDDDDERWLCAHVSRWHTINKNRSMCRLSWRLADFFDGPLLSVDFKHVWVLLSAFQEIWNGKNSVLDQQP